MDGVRAAGRCREDQRIDRQVGSGCGGRPDPNRAVGERDVASRDVGVRIDRDRCIAALARRCDNPASDLAAIGDQRSW